MRQAFFLTVLLALALPAHAAEPPKDEAQRLYQSYGDAVYQVQTIDLTSDRKSGIGSGFQFTADGLIATNYHVVAEAVQRPTDNRIEFLHDKGEKGQLTVLAVDVIHDLAIVRMDKPGKSFLSLGTSHLPKGVKLFSLGNPHDIGFTIIEGTYNGLSRESFIDKIHFSGSINPGMSGGPAISHDGRVTGINVATAGNQISFLVPVEPLAILQTSISKDTKSTNFGKAIQSQLLDNQKRNVDGLLKKDWDSMPFGPVRVPGRIDEVLKCWGGINHKDKDPYQYFYSICSTQDNIFLDNEFDTGAIFYRYDYTLPKDDMNLARFYDFYERQFSYPGGDYKNAKEDDVTNYDCNSRFVDMSGQRWKSNFCIRQYKKYPAVYDMYMALAMVGGERHGLSITFGAQGVSRESALALSEKFLKGIQAPLPAHAVKEKKEGKK